MVLPGGEGAVAEISGSGEGLGAWESQARGKKGLLDPSRLCRGRRTSGALSAGSCFLSALSSSAPAQLAAGGTPLTPSCPQRRGLRAQSLAALNAPCVVCAHQMLHPLCCQTRRGCDPTAAPTQSPAQKKIPTASRGKGGGDGRRREGEMSRSGGCWSPPSPSVHRASALSEHLLCTPRVSLALLRFRDEDRPRGDICSLCHSSSVCSGGKCTKEGRGGFSGMLQGMGMVREGCSVCGLFSSLQKDFKSYGFFLHGFTCLPLEEGMAQELGRTAQEDFQRWKS